MTIREYIADLWADLTAKQKAVVAGTIALVLVLMFSGWFDSLWSSAKVRQAEREAAQAKRDATAALERAANIANEIKRREEALSKVENNRDAKQLEVNSATEATNSARADYERAVRESRPDAPSTDQLCAELAALGYPCQ